MWCMLEVGDGVFGSVFTCLRSIFPFTGVDGMALVLTV